MMACCPYLYTIRILSRKWSYPTLHALEHRRTFSELKRELLLVTSRVLSGELKQLQAEGLIALEDGKYLLTPSGVEFVRSVRTMARWAQKFGPCSTCDGKNCSGCAMYKEAITGACMCDAH